MRYVRAVAHLKHAGQTWSYLPSDAPDYLTGNSLNLGTSTAIACLVVTTLLWMRWQNRKKDATASFDSVSIQSSELALGRKQYVPVSIPRARIKN